MIWLSGCETTSGSFYAHGSQWSFYTAKTHKRHARLRIGAPQNEHWLLLPLDGTIHLRKRCIENRIASHIQKGGIS
jgi:hypothetical protein